MVHMHPDVDVTTTTIPDYLTPEGLRASLDVEQPAVIAEGRWTGESTLRDHAGGPPIPVTIQSFLLRHPDSGEPFGLATVQRDIRERVAAQNALREAHDQRRALLERLVDAQEQERAQIAADVHDDSVQALAAVDLRLGLLEQRIRDAAPSLLQMVEQLQATVSGATDRLRELLFDLEPPAYDQSLSSGIRDIAAHIFEDGPSWELHNPSGADLGAGEKVKAVRIVREALRNIRQHARASSARIAIAARDGGVEIEIIDDGVGIDRSTAASPPGHRGLTSMADHAAIAGGWLTVGPGEEGGTRVQFWLPRSASEAISE
jgi:signal transduction histidine kinase